MVADAVASSGVGKHRVDRRRVLRALSVKNISAIYVWLMLIVTFSVLAPDAFPQVPTAKAVLNQYSVEGLVAVALVVPLAMGVFDLSVGATVGFAGVLAGWLLTNTQLPGGAVCVIVLGAGLAVGAFNALIVVGLGIDSFIGTLATSSILAAFALGLSGGNIFTERIAGSLSRYLTAPSVGGLTLPVLYLLVVTAAIGWLLDRTVTGRQAYAVGFDSDVARLAGVRVAWLRTVGLLISATISTAAGLVLVARLGAADPTTGPSYLLSAFAGAFVGATQFRRGWFNPWGTTVAVLMLGTGNLGLIMAGGPVWTPQLFNGVVLILAMAFTQGYSRPMPGIRIFGRRRRRS